MPSLKSEFISVKNHIKFIIIMVRKKDTLVLRRTWC